ncbi:hypothetical protein ACFY9X_34875 [Streptomyces nigra]
MERSGTNRAGAAVIEIDGTSHAVAVSRPDEAADLKGNAVPATT